MSSSSEGHIRRLIARGKGVTEGQTERGEKERLVEGVREGER